MVAALANLDTIDPLEERLRERLEALRANRERFVIEAQRNLAALDAAIAELGALLDPASLNGSGSEGDVT
jgi:Pyruvate/2-oxoacid:ferredoxin oxidoreductase gamma subunit